MNIFTHLIEQLHSDTTYGGGTQTLERINRPKKPSKEITPNRKIYFKNFNYRFKD